MYCSQWESRVSSKVNFVQEDKRAQNVCLKPLKHAMLLQNPNILIFIPIKYLKVYDLC